MVKNPPVMQETWVQSLSWEDPLEKPMTTHSSIVSQKISWTAESGGLQSMGSQRVGHDSARTHTHTHTTRLSAHTHTHTHTQRPPWVVYIQQCVRNCLINFTMKHKVILEM